ncbi:hypothetical protein ENSA5_41570 [Enhygromyxa salina]|uniref:Lipoprotein n=1 Tax=Enhygromyxa salina TaxID=215803 RepID=A0A2S9XMG7_9BACT|nr:hypothetical protein ENSA5_41570 [Enhygromyxa salina]
MRRMMALLVSSVLLASCGARQANDGDDIADGMPEWSPCAMKDEVQTCAELCATQGMQCVANGCPAEPEFCDPEPCDMATQVLALDAEAVCADPSSGAFVATTCEAPIDWLFSNTVRCCCAE